MPAIGDTARALKMWREMKDLNQRELAKLARLSYSTISDYEGGKTTVPHVETIAKVIAALGMTPEDLEVAERYVRFTWPKLQETQLGESDEPSVALASRGPSAMRRELAELVQEGSRILARFILVIIDLLVSIAERDSGS
jgi:transcriptional regulator with XRE-family HTH domain